MTELERQYAELRADGRGHRAALRELARRVGVDEPTVERVLRMARGEPLR